MASKKFRFVSPGVQLRELDRSQISAEPEAIGPVIIGRAQRGPALTPVKVDNYLEFVTIFGEPLPGGSTDDVWRNGNEGLAPTYGAYAAQAYLANGSPLTYIRLLGRSHTNATAAGVAGWKVGGDGLSDNGGAFGLFLVDSGSKGGDGAGGVTGTLAAVWYCQGDCTVELSGNECSSSAAAQGTGVFIGNPYLSSKGGGWEALVMTGSTVVERKKFNFDQTSGDFIRNQFNTNPTLRNSRTTPNTQDKPYFLGETYENSVYSTISSGSAAEKVCGVILPLQGSSYDVDYNVNQADSNPAASGWVVAQDTGPAASFSPETLTKLFRVVALEHGEWANGNLKISIEDIRYSSDPTNQFGTFTLSVRMAADSDTSPQVLESFAGLSLNPASPDYICARIGDQYSQWDDTKRSWRHFGEFTNLSKYIFIKADDNLGDSPGLLPFGYQGPLIPLGITLVSGSAGTQTSPGSISASLTTDQNKFAIPIQGTTIAGRSTNEAVLGGTAILGMPGNITASFKFPKTNLRASTKQGSLSDPTDAYWGLATTGSKGRFDRSYIDITRGIPGALNHGSNAIFGPPTDTTTNATVYSYIFTLDDLSRDPVAGVLATPHHFETYYVSGSRKSLSAISYSGSIGDTYGDGTYKKVLDEDFNQFTMPLVGGFDGTDIIEIEPFNNKVINGKTDLNNYAYNTLKIAIDTCADAERIDMNLMSMPGITDTSLTDRILDVCESRGDCLGIIDIPYGFKPKADRDDGDDNAYDSGVRGDAKTAADQFKTRSINNSYGAAYYPWVKVRDEGTGRNFYCPPSVPALGTLSYSEAVSDVWFAPAGFNRGGLSNGTAGIAVTTVTEKLSSKQRDKLYENNINPIASFPSEGVVVFGQKTTQQTRSALDRINVRRLMIHIKKEISRISNNLLFDPNVSVTWDRFTAQAEFFLNNIKSGLGLDDFKVILDSTTTTPDMIDRNVMYAKIFVKPSRAIEFIAVDFIITNTGASFED